jgi:hypothetical protein
MMHQIHNILSNFMKITLAASVLPCFVHAMEGDSDDHEKGQPSSAYVSQADMEAFLELKGSLAVQLQKVQGITALFAETIKKPASAQKVAGLQHVIDESTKFLEIDSEFFPEVAKESCRRVIKESKLGQAEALFILGMQDH